MSILSNLNKTIGRATYKVGAVQDVADLFGLDPAGALGLNGSSRKADVGFDIARFKSEVEDRGLQRPELFAVQMFIPKTLMGKTATNPQSLQMLCARAALPGISFMTEEAINTGYGPTVKMPYRPIFHDLQLEFIVDGDHKIASFFQQWARSIFNYDSSKGMNSKTVDTGVDAYNVNYRNQYSINMDVIAFDPTAQEITRYQIYNAYPITLGDINLNWSPSNGLATLPVTMSYVDYYVSTTAASKVSDPTGLSLIQTLQKGLSAVQVVGSLRKPEGLGDIINVVNNAKLITKGFGL